MGGRVGWFGALLILIRRGLPERQEIPRLVVFFALLLAGMALLQSACYPWAYSLGLNPTLTGTWVGELSATGRGKHVAFIDLRDDIGDSGGPDVNGTVKMCDTRGETHAFGLSGNTLNWRGDRFRLTTYITESHDRDAEGVKFARVDGEWDRGDTVQVTANLELWRILGGGTFASTDRPPAQIALEDTPVRFILTRAPESRFRETCERLPGQAPGAK